MGLLHKMYEYEMGPAIVEDTDRTPFGPQSEGQTDGGTRWNHYTPY